jgi:hypothetical protein
LALDNPLLFCTNMTKKFYPMSPLRKPRASKAEMELRARTAQRSASTLLPSPVQERQHMPDECMRDHSSALAMPIKICTAGMGDTSYRTGDGEVIQQPRPGSLHAFTLPSRGNRT